MKATREQVLVMAREAQIEGYVADTYTVLGPEELDRLVHLAQQFTLDQLRAQGAALTIKQHKYDMREPKTESLYRIPETLE